MIAVTCPALLKLTEENYDACIQYFGSTSRSGGGEIVNHERITSSSDGCAITLLLTFAEDACELTFIICIFTGTMYVKLLGL